MSRKWFRFLALLQWVLAAASIALFFVERSSLPPELRDYLDAQDEAPPDGRDILIWLSALGGVVLNVAATVGLYRFRPWGRALFLWGAVIGYALSPFLLTEPSVTPPLAGVLMSLNMALYGFVMALLYFSPVARYFGRGPSA